MTTDDDRTRRLFAETQALAHLGVWELDAVSGEVFWSDELYQICGLAPREIEPSFEAMLDRIHPDDLTSVKAFLSRARRERSPSAMEYRMLRPHGGHRTVQTRVRASHDTAGTLQRLVGVVQDISETKEVAARVVFSDRMVSLGTLAGGVAHEINNPLATIAAQLQVLEEAHGDPNTRDAHAAVERIRNIVRGLTVFSRTDDDVRGSVDLHRVMELAIGLTSNEIRHRARLVRQFGTPPNVTANEARLGHAFINLLANAAEAIPEGNADKHEIRVVTRADAAGWAIVEIHDSGIGIPSDVMPRIFDPFFTTKPVGQGTGLGLSICHGIVRSLGGDIHVRSERGKGASFIIALPPAVGTPRTLTPPEAPIVAPAEGGRVLVIDDDVTFATSLRRLLAGEHTVVVMNSGRVALDVLRRGERFDAILCDLMMPEMTGGELHAELSAIDRDLADRIIFITGGAFSPASQRFLERVPNLCLEKPCNIKDLRAAIRQRISASRQ